MRRSVRFLQRLFPTLAIAAAALLGWSYWTAVSKPVVRSIRVAVAGWPAGAPPLRLLLLSDVHIGGPDMPPARVRRIVGQINRLATIAVLGNHDHWRDAAAARRALSHAGIRLLENQAVQVGPVAIGGLDDDFTGRADLPATLAALRKLSGPRFILSHSPDPFPDLGPDIFLMLAGHTHCGQVALPLVGPISTMSRYGRRYACGVVREGDKSLVVTAGLGTSGIPLRLGAVPDLWLVEVGP